MAVQHEVYPRRDALRAIRKRQACQGGSCGLRSVGHQQQAAADVTTVFEPYRHMVLTQRQLCRLGSGQRVGTALPGKLPEGLLQLPALNDPAGQIRILHAAPAFEIPGAQTQACERGGRRVGRLQAALLAQRDPRRPDPVEVVTLSREVSRLDYDGAQLQVAGAQRRHAARGACARDDYVVQLL